jgi:hypothetical protein
LWNVNAQAYLIGCPPFEQTLHHIIPDNRLLHTHCPSKFCQTMAVVNCRIQHLEDQVLSVGDP